MKNLLRVGFASLLTLSLISGGCGGGSSSSSSGGGTTTSTITITGTVSLPDSSSSSRSVTALAVGQTKAAETNHAPTDATVACHHEGVELDSVDVASDGSFSMTIPGTVVGELTTFTTTIPDPADPSSSIDMSSIIALATGTTEAVIPIGADSDVKAQMLLSQAEEVLEEINGGELTLDPTDDLSAVAAVLEPVTLTAGIDAAVEAAGKLDLTDVDAVDDAEVAIAMTRVSHRELLAKAFVDGKAGLGGGLGAIQPRDFMRGMLNPNAPGRADFISRWQILNPTLADGDTVFTAAHNTMKIFGNAFAGTGTDATAARVALQTAGVSGSGWMVAMGSVMGLPPGDLATYRDNPAPIRRAGREIIETDPTAGLTVFADRNARRAAATACKAGSFDGDAAAGSAAIAFFAALPEPDTQGKRTYVDTWNYSAVGAMIFNVGKSLEGGAAISDPNAFYKTLGVGMKDPSTHKVLATNSDPGNMGAMIEAARSGGDVAALVDDFRKPIGEIFDGICTATICGFGSVCTTTTASSAVSMCSPRGNVGHECTVANQAVDCPGLECKGGRCGALDVACNATGAAACPSGTSCQEGPGTCVPSDAKLPAAAGCSTDSQCTSGDCNTKGVCVGLVKDAPCRNPIDCDSGLCHPERHVCEEAETTGLFATYNAILGGTEVITSVATHTTEGIYTTSITSAGAFSTNFQDGSSGATAILSTGGTIGTTTTGFIPSTFDPNSSSSGTTCSTAVTAGLTCSLSGASGFGNCILPPRQSTYVCGSRCPSVGSTCPISGQTCQDMGTQTNLPTGTLFCGIPPTTTTGTSTGTGTTAPISTAPIFTAPISTAPVSATPTPTVVPTGTQGTTCTTTAVSCSSGFDCITNTQTQAKACTKRCTNNNECSAYSGTTCDDVPAGSGAIAADQGYCTTAQQQGGGTGSGGTGSGGTGSGGTGSGGSNIAVVHVRFQGAANSDASNFDRLTNANGEDPALYAGLKVAPNSRPVIVVTFNDALLTYPGQTNSNEIGGYTISGAGGPLSNFTTAISGSTGTHTFTSDMPNGSYRIIVSTATATGKAMGPQVEYLFRVGSN